MPELPEVTTTVRGLEKILPGLTVKAVWTDLAKKKPLRQFKDTLKSEAFLLDFKKRIQNKKILSVSRRGKNILIDVSGGETVLIHLKMTGHILYGTYIYNKKENKWTPHPNEQQPLHDPFNRFIHVVFTLSNNKQCVLCDARKFGKVTLLKTRDKDTSVHLFNLGPEPLDKEMTYAFFKEQILKNRKKSIKTVLMDQRIIVGIGNIYSDEMLWLAGIHPESYGDKIPESHMKKLFDALQTVLKKGIDFGGDSTSDYRDVNGKPGKFHHHHNVYRKTKERCGKKGCSGVILRKVIHGRSGHFCDKHQKLFR